MNRFHDKQLRRQSERLRLMETVVIVSVIAVLMNLSLAYIDQYVARTKLAQVFADAGHKRLAVAEALSLTGELPDSLQPTTKYRFEHAMTVPRAVTPVSLSTGFGVAQKAIEDKLLTKSTAKSKSPAETESLRMVESARPAQGYFDREPGTQSSFSSPVYTEGDNVYISGGSFYYLIDHLSKASEAEKEIVSFVVNSTLRKKTSSIWYSCAPSTETSLGSAATSEYITRIENKCL